MASPIYQNPGDTALYFQDPTQGLRKISSPAELQDLAKRGLVEVNKPRLSLTQATPQQPTPSLTPPPSASTPSLPDFTPQVSPQQQAPQATLNDVIKQTLQKLQGKMSSFDQVSGNYQNTSRDLNNYQAGLEQTKYNTIASGPNSLFGPLTPQGQDRIRQLNLSGTDQQVAQIKGELASRQDDIKTKMAEISQLSDLLTNLSQQQERENKNNSTSTSTSSSMSNANLKFIPATKYQSAGFVNLDTGEFTPTDHQSVTMNTPSATGKKSVGNGSAGGNSTGSLSDQAQAIINGTLRLEDLTPTARGKIAGELTRAGYKSGPNLSASQQDDLANMKTVTGMIDQLLTYNADGKLEGVGFGTGGLGSIATKIFGTGSEEAKNVRALIGNIKGTIAKLRGGTSFTPNEEALLNSYVPSINENAASVISKLVGLKQFISSKQANTLQFGQERGVKQVPATSDLRSKYNY